MRSRRRAASCSARAYELLHPARTEPWGQTVTRLVTGDGLIVGISCAPAFRGRQRA